MRTLIVDSYYMDIRIGIGFLIIMLITISCDSTDDQGFRNWESYQGDDGRTGYSSLDQINKENVDQLEISWTFETGEPGTMQVNPIVIDEIMYVISAKMKVYALDAATGDEIWMFDPFEGENRRGLSRGVAYWEDDDDKRILFSAGSFIYALNADNGKNIKEFGQEGKVSLNEGLGRDASKLSVRSTSPGTVYQDLLIQGSSVGETYDAPPGHVRAYDIRTGELKWTFHTIPQPGEPGYETWEPDSWLNIGGANVWAGTSLDKERGLVYLPVAAPKLDFYGGGRKGKNLYANSLVALDAATGEHVWHYQTIHHDIWDYDLPAPPNLVTVERDGQQIDAVAQITKTGFVFLFDRVSGESLFPITERVVPPSNIESEDAWPTQPIPEKPDPFVRQHFQKKDITTISSEAYDDVLNRFEQLRSENLFTPPDTSEMIILPGTRGGGNWGGPAYDPENNVLYISAKESPELAKMSRVTESISGTATLFNLGKNFYVQNCASCHGMELQGQPPATPSLVDLNLKQSEEEALNLIKNGSGRMPGFKEITGQQSDAIIGYLFDKSDAKSKEVEIEDEGEGQSNLIRYVNIRRRSYFNDPDGYPAIKPPWGTLNALDLDTGEYLWRIPLGEYPELTEKGIPVTGMENWGGPIVTGGGLVFIAATLDKKFRAFDKETGELLWETSLPTAGIAKPATYMINGKQYVVIAVGGGRGAEPGDSYITFTIPN